MKDILFIQKRKIQNRFLGLVFSLCTITSSLFSQDLQPSRDLPGETPLKPSIQSFFTEEVKWKIREYVQKQTISTGTPALMYTLVEGDKFKTIEYFHSPNYPSMEGKYIPIGSISRQLTLLAAYKLRDESKLNFDAKIKDYLPELRIGKEGRENLILVKNLLNSSAGFKMQEETLLHRPEGYIYFTAEELTSHFGELDYFNAPAEKYEESNFNYVLLAQIISKTSGKKYEKYIEEDVLKPLGMENIFFSNRRYRKSGTPIYDYFFGSRVVVNPEEIPDAFNPAYKSYASADDLATYISFQLKNLPTDIYSHVTLSEMQQGKTHVKGQSGVTFGGGWFTKEFYGQKIIYSEVKGRGCSGVVYLKPDTNIGVAIIMNIESSPIHTEIGEGVLAIMMGVHPDNASVSSKKTITLLSFLILIVAMILLFAVAIRMDRFFSMLPAQFPEEEKLTGKFLSAVGAFVFLFWLFFLQLPGSDWGISLTVLPYSSSMYGWIPELFYSLILLLMVAFLWMVYLGFSILRISESIGK